MKILSRAEFLKLPAGTMFAKGKPCYWENLSVKERTLPAEGEYRGDFVSTDIVDFWNDDDNDSGQHFESFDRMVETGCSYPLSDMGSRDGCFDEEDLFLIYEPADLESLIEHARNAIEVAKVPA